MDVTATKLDQEVARYDELKPSLLAEHAGEYVVIRGGEVLGIFADWEAAYVAGRKAYGNVPILVRRILSEQPIYSIWTTGG